MGDALKNLASNNFFLTGLETSDSSVFDIIGRELSRQQNQVELIASENIVSKAVLDAQGSVLTNKYAEGYSGNRYYGGCEFIDQVEDLAIERLCKLFGVKYANVQPNSGSQANQSVFLALLKPNDTVLGMSLDAGGHLTHGAKPNMSGKWFNAIAYGVRKDDGLIDYEQVAQLAQEHKPKLIVAGASAYPRQIDFKKFREIADSVGAYLMVDIAHYAGLVVGGVYESPVGYADVITSTTHKTLRGPRGGVVMTDNENIAKKINSAIFPGLQGGPLEHVIAAKAVAFGEALQPEFKTYAKNVLDNARVLADTLKAGGLDIVTGGTDSHMVLVDLRPKFITGNVAAVALENAHMTCNKNAIPFDPEKPTVTSGIRLGTPAGTTRGFGKAEFKLVGEYIVEVLDALSAGKNVEKEVAEKVLALCAKFPIY